jgi:hypothetical protein
MVGLLGTLAEDEQVAAYVLALAAGATGTPNSHRALGLRALGGLLAGGIYDEQKLAQIRAELSASSKAQDRAAGEFFEVLLGKRSPSERSRFDDILSRQQEDIARLNRRLQQQEEALAEARQRAERAEARATRSQPWGQETIEG